MNRKHKLLVIDDNAADFLLLTREMERQGVLAECTWICDREALIHALQEGGWDAILSDYAVPGLEFMETLELVRSLDPLLPLILVTGAVGDEEAVELLKRGAWDFLLKDRPTRLSTVIERSLREARERKALAIAEEALRQREALLDAFFKASPSGMAFLDRQGRHVKVNEAIAEISGSSQETMLGKVVREVVPHLADVVEPIIESVIATGRPMLNLEISGETPRQPGVKRHWLVSHFPIADSGKEVMAVGVIVTEITERKHAEEMARASEARAQELLRQNRYLTHHTITLLEQDRRRLARELHDELGQWITAIQAEAEAIRTNPAGPKHDAIGASARAISSCASQVQQVMRNLVNELRPSLLDMLGLPDSLGELISQWRRHHSIDCELSMEGRLEDLGETMNITIYRIVQEALTNIARHAQARQVSVRLGHLAEGAAKEIRLIVENDGHALPSDTPTSGTGVLGMRERALALGGVFEITSGSAGGVRIEVRLPAPGYPSEEASS